QREMRGGLGAIVWFIGCTHPWAHRERFATARRRRLRASIREASAPRVAAWRCRLSKRNTRRARHAEREANRRAAGESVARADRDDDSARERFPDWCRPYCSERP